MHPTAAGNFVFNIHLLIEIAYTSIQLVFCIGELVCSSGSYSGQVPLSPGLRLHFK